nr:MAG TPA: hypothetical protein [Caudoviricetes sp.]
MENLSSEQWAAVRKFAYAIIPLVGNLLIALGFMSTELWQIVSGILLQVVTFGVAFFNVTPTNPTPAGAAADVEPGSPNQL